MSKSKIFNNPIYFSKRNRFVKGQKFCAFSMDVVEEICERLAQGETLNSICQGDRFPSRRSFNEWVITNKEVAEKYIVARQLQATHYADEMIEIVDHPFDQIKEFVLDLEKRKTLKTEDVMAFDSIAKYLVQLQRNRIDTRKWLCGKLYSKVFGDQKSLKEQVEEIKTNINLSNLSDEELEILERAHVIAARAGNNKGGESQT